MSSPSPLLLSLLGACASASPEPGAAQTPVLVATAAASAPEKPMITRTQAGLADAHVGQVPLFDRIELNRNEVRGARTYEDGAQYLIHHDPNTSGAGAATWTRFVSITPAGIEQARSILRTSVLGWQPPPPGPSAGGGTIVWVIHVDGQERVLETRSGNYEALPAWVRALDEAVSHNVVPAG